MVPPEAQLSEANTRKQIDRALISAGWVIQNKKRLNLYESLGVAVREMDTDTGPADYMLFIDGKACGIDEAKLEGAGQCSVADQLVRYAHSKVKHVERWVPEGKPLPILCEATNHETRLRDERDPTLRFRVIFHFQKTETLETWLEEGVNASWTDVRRLINPVMLRGSLQDLHELNTESLRLCQIEAIYGGIEHSLKQFRSRVLLKMTAGSGKTYTAVIKAKRRTYLMKSEGFVMGKSPTCYEKMEGCVTHIFSCDELHKDTPMPPTKKATVGSL